MKQKVNVYDLSSIANHQKENKKPKINRSKDVFCCGGKNSSVKR